MTLSSAVHTHAALAAVLLLCCMPDAATGIDFPEHLDGISIRPDLMWQELPDEVKAVFVGPDNRTWIELDHPAQAENLDRVKAIVAREFGSLMPQLLGCRPALFEPGGRVWFITHSATVLLGYDGTNMIERTMPARHFLPGNCPNHGKVYRSGNNLVAAGQAFFVESHGVLRFHGGQWDYQQMVPDAGDRRPQNYPELSIEPDGRGVVAFLRSETSGQIRRWSDGKWNDVDAACIGPTNIANIAPRSDGIWFFKDRPVKCMVFLPNDTSKVAAAFPDLVRQLGAQTFAERQAATEALKAMGAPIRPAAERALAATDDPEVLERLKEVIAAVSPDAGSLSSFGPYQVRDPVLELYDPFGTMYVTATEIVRSGERLGPGLVRQDARGTFSCVPSKDFAATWRSIYSENSGPLVVPGKEWVWRTSQDRDNRAQLLDMVERATIRDVPGRTYRWLHAARKDGSVFVSQREPTQSARPVVLFNPSAQDTCLWLTAGQAAESDDEPVITGDGVIFAVLNTEGLALFGGDGWKPIRNVPSRMRLPNAAAGRSGIVVPGSPCYLVGSSGEVLTANSTEDLLRLKSALVEKAIGSSALNVLTDGKRNIWYRDATGRLKVLVGEEWVSADKELRDAGSRTGTIRYMAVPVGGDAVYVSDLMSVHSAGRSFFGRVSDGKPVFTQAPHTCEETQVRRNVHDADGALWIPGSIRGSGGTCDWIGGQLAHRIQADGSGQVYTNAGWAVLCDAGGNVWLGSIRGRRESEFNVWRKGQITGTVTVSGATAYSTLVSDRPGSVFVWTGEALRHLTSSAPDKTDFSLRETYYLKNISGDVLGFGYSPLGFFVIRWRSERPMRTFVTVIPVPRK